MNYEQKYKEALEIIKGNLDALNEISETGAGVVNIQSIKNCFYRAFPELKESEDEKIRKWIINEIKIKHHNLDEDNVDFVDKAIAWLERHGKQKSIWHDVSEMPIGAYDEEILVQFADFHSSVLLIDDWKYLDHIVRWAYLKDLKEE